jgi:adenosylhomocysteine nucleosidase
MEAAGVARAARERNTGFLCVKSISDEFDFSVPRLDRFVDGEGNFKTGSFAAWTALRPQHWPKVLELSRNSARALRALAAWLDQNTSGGVHAGAVTLERVL